jgi:hypothetical protein
MDKKMKRPQMLTSLLIFGLLVSVASCGKDTSGPSQPTKSPREMTWTADTIAYPGSYQTLMWAIGGSSETNIFIAGHNDQPYGMMYHFDGWRWSPVKLSSLEGGPFPSLGSFNEVIAFKTREMFAVGDKWRNLSIRPFVAYNDGLYWSELQLTDTSSTRITSAWGASPADMWVGTFEGMLHHYNGVTFKQDSIGGIIQRLKSGSLTTSIQCITGYDSKEVYLLVWVRSLTYDERYYILTNRTGGWIILDSLANGNISRIWLSPGRQLYRVGWGLYVLEGNTWKALLPGVQAFGIAGTSDNNIVVVGTDYNTNYYGTVYHFDGNSWYNLLNLQFSDTHYWRVWMNEKEVFVVGTFSSVYKSIVLHGK